VPKVQGCVDLAKMYGLPTYTNVKEALTLVREILENYEYYRKRFISVREKVLRIHDPRRIAEHFLKMYGL